MLTGWLLRDDEVLANAEWADSVLDRFRGVLGRCELDSAILLPGTRSVHTFGVRFPLDVAFLDSDLVVLSTTQLRARRVAIPRLRSRCALETPAGWFERWKLEPGDKLEFRAVR
jgi:uncharacterized protein